MKKIMISLVAVIFATSSISISAYGQETDTITDSRDSHIYKTVKIGDQWWMAENLKFWADKNSPYYKGVSYFYKGVNEYYYRYGRLYSWEVAKEVCPDGWHLPSMDEWYSLINNFGDLYDANDKNPIKKESSKKSKEIKKLRKEINAALREDGKGGFDVLYGGYRDPNPPTTTSYNANLNFLENLAENLADHPGYYFGVENCAFFWSSNDNVEKGMFKKQKANGFQFLKSKWSKPFYPIPIKKLNGCSVRCVKDK
ncbi:MAG: hypothetical protein KAT48_00995 [Bacteroidales bacterium]|nr:hypothetical protein [Bacteroidales bacterium]